MLVCGGEVRVIYILLPCLFHYKGVDDVRNERCGYNRQVRGEKITLKGVNPP